MTGIRQTLVCASIVLTVLAVGACGASEPSGEAATTPATQTRDAPAARSEASEPAAADDRFGPALEAPQLYYGIYAAAETPEREWFVTEAKRPQYAEHALEVPPGHLMIGALFGDVAPWQMRTLSATEFEQAWVAEGQSPVTVRFDLDADGRAVAMTFTDPTLGDEGRLERRGDLPEDLR